MRRILAKLSLAAFAFGAGMTWGIIADAAEMGMLKGF
ncbi:hypothetical protein HY3_02330 [Hyphomonas pacifica]|uniref:Uncharacterized protein n=1 Tax=Hyphomonas pacifica TaxID=1280941 RepID=A0A062TVR7_9PROT|nr:hypothetical protein HY2_03165 [Hyphomonas pacifica]RAN32935.1 hypothetical protein HY11_04395 [Hyphomonas pacifica]RAN33206.1 hypothetical protein HY3_02330 [Hyphomonas pacifica]